MTEWDGRAIVLSGGGTRRDGIRNGNVRFGTGLFVLVVLVGSRHDVGYRIGHELILEAKAKEKNRRTQRKQDTYNDEEA
jgi:hypothetical protein